MFDQQAEDDERHEDDDPDKREPQAAGSALRDEQTAAHHQAGKCDAHRKHAQTRLEAETLPGSRLAVAARARSMNAYASISRCPFCRIGSRWHIFIDQLCL